MPGETVDVLELGATFKADAKPLERVASSARATARSTARDIERSLSNINPRQVEVQRPSTGNFIAAMSEAGISGGRAAADGVHSELMSGAVAKGTMVGSLIASGIQAALRGISVAVEGGFNFVKGGIEEVANYERMGLSLTALSKAEIMRTNTIKERVQIGTRVLTFEDQMRAALQGTATSEEEAAKAAQKNTDNSITRERLLLSIAEARNTLATRTPQGKNPDMVKFDIDGKQLENAIKGWENQLSKIKDVATESDDIIGKTANITGPKTIAIYKQQTRTLIDDAEARRQAAERSKELLGWSQKLAIESPFQQDGVVNALRLAMAYGFTSKEAQRLTKANIDFTAASGGTEFTMDRIARAMGQIKARGKLAAGEVLQLSEAGLNVREILADAFGVTVQEANRMIEKGLVPADKAIEAITTRLEKDFGGAAKDQAGLLSGLISSIEDLKQVGLRDLFTQFGEVMKGPLNDVVTLLQNPAFRSALQGIGSVIANIAMGPFKLIGSMAGGAAKFLERFTSATKLGVRPVYAFRLALAQFVPDNLQEALTRASRFLQTFLDNFDFQSNLKGDRWAGFWTSVKFGLSEALGADAKLWDPMIEYLQKIPEKVSGIVDDLKKGKLKEALQKIWGDLGVGDVVTRIPGFVAGLAGSIAQSIGGADAIKAVGDAFLNWGNQGLEWINATLTEEKFKEKLVTAASELGKAAGNTISDVSKAFSSWVLELAGFPAKATSSDMEPAIRTFVKTFGTTLGTMGGLWDDASSAFLDGLLTSMGLKGSVIAESIIKSVLPGGQTGDIQTGAQLLVDQYVGNKATLESAGATAGATIRAGIVKAFSSPESYAEVTKDVSPVGSQIAAGISLGLGGYSEEAKKQARLYLQAQIDDMKEYLGIESPSTVLADSVGLPMAQGVANGFINNLSYVSDALSMISTLILNTTQRVILEAPAIGQAMVVGILAGMGLKLEQIIGKGAAGQVVQGVSGALPGGGPGGTGTGTGGTGKGVPGSKQGVTVVNVTAAVELDGEKLDKRTNTAVKKSALRDAARYAGGSV